MRFPFSPRTIGYLVEAIASAYSKANMRTLFLKAGIDVGTTEHSSREAAAQTLLLNLREAATEEAHTCGRELVRLVLTDGKPDKWCEPARWWTHLKDAIAADGWDFDDEADRLVPIVPGAPLSEEVNWIERELERRGWATAAGHYLQAVESFAEGQWAAANGQLRTFYESLIRTAAGNQNASGSGQVQAAFKILDSLQRLILGEADFGEQLWGLLHPHGSHPGLSDEDESRFRLLTLTGYARFLLSRLPD